MTTILTIDDDVAITELLATILRVQGFDVITANDGLAGIELIKDKAPQVVVLDLMMPGMDGWEVCKALRAFSNIPILILSALNDPSIVASILDAGADDYLVKPVPSAVLVAHINRLCRRTGILKSAPTNMTLQSNSHPLAP
jgi:DNA-binding response OmpR family regulator